MVYERLVGLNVTNDALYEQYRASMAPILKRYGGSFRYDFRIAEVLKNESGAPINRVFIIDFPDKVSKESFFGDSEYLEVRNKFFTPAVGASTTLAEYERD